ncbi:MAG: AbrB/MazE/SpoVT family DNA-binding domain-containing protein [Longimicrobiales bacterium]
MAYQVTIDAAGRLVIPKPLRQRFGLGAGTRLYMTAEGGAIRLSPDRPEPALVERDGFLVVDLTGDETFATDHRIAREKRASELKEYATRR